MIRRCRDQAAAGAAMTVILLRVQNIVPSAAASFYPAFTHSSTASRK
jgi:hypothetical protein